MLKNSACIKKLVLSFSPLTGVSLINIWFVTDNLDMNTQRGYVTVDGTAVTETESKLVDYTHIRIGTKNATSLTYNVELDPATATGAGVTGVLQCFPGPSKFGSATMPMTTNNTGVNSINRKMKLNLNMFLLSLWSLVSKLLCARYESK